MIKGDTYMGHIKEDSGEEEKHHYEDNEMSDEDHIKAIEHHLAALKKDRDYDEDHEALEEGGRADKDDPNNRRVTNNTRPLEEGEGMATEDALTDEPDVTKNESLKENIKRVLKKNKKLRLRFK
jgi:hypothetical protein